MPRLFGLLCALIGGACASSTAPQLSYEGHSDIVATSPTVVDAVVTVRNLGSTTASISAPVCPLRIIAYDTAERDDEPLWASSGDTCITTLEIRPPIVLGPGDFYDFALRQTLPTTLSGRRVFLSISAIGGRQVSIGQVIVK